MFSGMFGWSAPADPKEQVKKWKSELRSEGRKLERQINSARHTAAAQFRGRAAQLQRAKNFPAAAALIALTPLNLLLPASIRQKKKNSE